MTNSTKSRSTSSIFADNISIAAITKQNTLSFQRISHGQSPPRNEQSYIIMNTIDNDPLTRSILIDSANRQRGFLPHDYRIGNTFETIRRQRIYHKALSTFPVLPSTTYYRTSPRYDAFGNITSKMSKLAEQRLILREKLNRKQQNLPIIHDQQEKYYSHTMSDANFATDIPNALEYLFKKTKKKSPMERHLLDMMKRERLQQARYRLLPINRAPVG